MSSRQDKVTVSERKTFGNILRHLGHWEELIKIGPHNDVLEVNGRSYSYSTILDGLDCLTKLQRDALVKIYVEDKAVSDAAEEMGKPSSPINHYADTALEKLIRFNRAQDRGEELPRVKSLPLTRKGGAL